MTVSRVNLLQDWLSLCFDSADICLHALSGDAGFRCYYRFSHQGAHYLAVDALPTYSNNAGFVAIAEALTQQNIKVPEIVHCDMTQGFMCIEDFGDALLSTQLNLTTAKPLYRQAIDLLPALAQTQLTSAYTLPSYDSAFILTEMNIFTEWLLGRHLALELSIDEQQQLLQCFSVLTDSALEQPRVFMHRDYHCRNIMLVAPKQLGIIDFQDAVQGPITYDIVSLLRDCYIRWPDAMVDELFDYFCQQITPLLPQTVSKAQWQRWFDLMGLQRHIKASGIFARLKHRDNKTNYLKDIPLTLDYIIDISAKYPELRFLTQLVTDQVKPRFLLKASADKETK